LSATASTRMLHHDEADRNVEGGAKESRAKRALLMVVLVMIKEPSSSSSS